MKKILLILVMISISSFAFAEEREFEILGVKLGMYASEVKMLHPNAELLEEGVLAVKDFYYPISEEAWVIFGYRNSENKIIKDIIVAIAYSEIVSPKVCVGFARGLMEFFVKEYKIKNVIEDLPWTGYAFDESKNYKGKIYGSNNHFNTKIEMKTKGFNDYKEFNNKCTLMVEIDNFKSNWLYPMIIYGINNTPKFKSDIIDDKFLNLFYKIYNFEPDIVGFETTRCEFHNLGLKVKNEYIELIKNSYDKNDKEKKELHIKFMKKYKIYSTQQPLSKKCKGEVLNMKFKPPSSVVNNKQFLLNKWWGMVENGKCNLKPGEASLALWDNKGNEYYIIDKKQAEKSYKIKTNAEWVIMWYGKADLAENYINGEYYYNEEEGVETLINAKAMYTFQTKGKIKNMLVMNYLDVIKTDESGKKTKEDWQGKVEYSDCGINNIRGTKEFSSQLKIIKSKLKKLQSKK